MWAGLWEWSKNYKNQRFFIFREKDGIVEEWEE
jgi:hypothetical protein